MNEEKPHDRTGQPVVIPQREIRPQQLIFGSDETGSELSVESRSFLSTVNGQVRKRQQRSSMNVTEDEEKHSVIWRMPMSVCEDYSLKVNEFAALPISEPVSRYTGYKPNNVCPTVWSGPKHLRTREYVGEPL